MVMKMRVLDICLLLTLCAYSCRSELRVHSCSNDTVIEPCTLECCGSGSALMPVSKFFDENGHDILYSATDFTVPRCSFTDRATGEFICSTTRSSGCHTRKYTCEVKQGRDTAQATIHALVRNREQEIVETCRPPSITNVDATLHSDAMVTVTWEYSKGRSLPYCNGSRLFSMANISYATYEEAISNDTVIFSDGDYQDAGKRSTEFNISSVDTNHFYRFLVRARKGGSSTIHTKAVATTLKYFQETEPIVFEVAFSEHHVKEGDSFSTTCDVSGDPTPTVTYRKVDSTHLRPSLVFEKVQIGDEGLYVCRACHDVFNNELGVMENVCSSANRQLYVIPKEKGRDCVTYLMGDQCYEYIHTDWKVFSENDTHLTEARIASVVEISHRFSKKCRLFIKSVLCHMVLPYCDPFTVDTGPYNPLPMCPVTCTDVEEQCGQEIDRFGESFSKFLKKRCAADIAKSANVGPGDKPGCIYVNPDHPLKGGPDTDLLSEEQTTTKCILGNGQSYRGKETVTQSGFECQKWSLDWPNEHEIDTMMGGEIGTASKYCRNPGGIGERPWCFIGNALHPRWEYCDIPDCEQCIPYTEDFCNAIGYDQNTTVFFRQQVKDTVIDMELELRGLSHIMEDNLKNKLTPGCQLLVKQLLCLGALPTCSNGVKSVMCAAHCNLLDMLQICPVGLSEIIDSVDYLDFSACNNRTLLPPSVAPQCLPKPNFIVSSGLESGAPCHNESDLGQTYTGDNDLTQSFLLCLPWSDVADGEWVKNFPELEGSFCRNPGQLGERPWCFTTVSGAWEYCNVSLCSDMSLPLVVKAAPGINTPIIRGVVIGGTLIIVLLVISVLVMICCYYKSNMKLKPNYKGENPCLVTNSIYSTQTLLSPELMMESDSFRKIEQSKIKYIKEIGRGNFGVVFQGECEWIKKNNEEDTNLPTKIAVKTLKQESKKDAINDFIREAKILHKFEHPHIVEFYGVSMDTLPFYMVFEYMDQGDLCQYLRTRGSSAQRRYNPPIQRERISSSVSTDSATLGTTELLDICKQVSSGMAYLESKNHIHRDLASRNCLVSSGMIVKIADFGMSQNLYTKDYYRVSGEASLPVRWMAPESILYGTFSTKADVWSFGVVVWEIFSFGLQPYWGSPNDAVVDLVRKGKLLENPESCPDKVYSLIMGGCWRMEECDRMTFAALNRSFEEMRLSDSDVSLSPDYDQFSTEDTDSVFSENDDNDKDY